MWDPQNERVRNLLLLALNSKANDDLVIRHSMESSFLDPKEILTEDHLRNLLFAIITYGDVLEVNGEYKAVSYCQNGIRFYLLWSENAEREFSLLIERQLSIFQEIKKVFKVEVLKKTEKSWNLDARVLTLTCEEGVSVDLIVQASFNFCH
jgi:hypothetical protein